MSLNDRQNESLKVVKVVKHFLSISDSDSATYGTDDHNPGNLYISFLNPNITNISSSTDATITTFLPISLALDVTYNNIATGFKNNAFKVSTTAGNLISVGGVVEDAAPIIVTIPDGVYKVGVQVGAAILLALNAKAITWVGVGGAQIVWTNTAYDANTNTMRFAYATNAPAGAPIIRITSVFAFGGVNFDSSRILGTNGGFFDITPYADHAAGLTTPNFMDLQTLQVIRIHSNISKRYFAKRGSGSANLRPLTNVDILMEIVLDAQLGQTFFWQPPNIDIYSQEINSNFDELTLRITDKYDNLVVFNNNAEFSMQFSVERQVVVPDNEQRIQSLSDYNRFRSM